MRLSIAGYQDKLAVHETDGGWSLVDGAVLASTHIPKPDPLAPRSMLTTHLVDRDGEPTQAALLRALAFLREQLGPGLVPGLVPA